MPPTKPASLTWSGVALQIHNRREAVAGSAGVRRLLAGRRRSLVLLGPFSGQEQSAALREKLLVDLSQLQSADEAADWVHKNLAAKNTLIAADADAVEAGFREKLATIEVASVSSSGTTAVRCRQKILNPRLGSHLSLRLKMQSQSRRQLPRRTPASGAVALRRKPFACATRSTVSSSGLSRASCAAARRPRPITFGLLSPVLSAER